MQAEVWQSIQGYEGIYEVSNFGRIKSLSRLTEYSNGSMRVQPEKILQNVYDHKGYLIVCLYKNRKQKNHKVHRLTAIAFLPNPDNKPVINHKNGKKDDNRLSNIEWCAESENIQHAYDTGLLDVVNRRAVNVYKNGEFVETIESIQSACDKYKVGKNTLYEIANGKREEIRSLKFLFT